MPDVEIVHFVEESMIREVMKNGGASPDINARTFGYVQRKREGWCAIFMTACSSIGASVEQCQFLTRMPVTRVDEAMVEEAKVERACALLYWPPWKPRSSLRWST